VIVSPVAFDHILKYQTWLKNADRQKRLYNIDTWPLLPAAMAAATAGATAAATAADVVVKAKAMN
jgi:TRAP-type mannitol/chloroaromatic compound transport system substrate-binding protein